MACALLPRRARLRPPRRRDRSSGILDDASHGAEGRSRGRRIPGMGTCLLGISLMLLCGRPAAAADEEFPTELRTISGIKLEGRHSVPSREIWAALKTKQPSIFPWREKPRLRIDFLR